MSNVRGTTTPPRHHHHARAAHHFLSFLFDEIMTLRVAGVAWRCDCSVASASNRRILQSYCLSSVCLASRLSCSSRYVAVATSHSRYCIAGACPPFILIHSLPPSTGRCPAGQASWAAGPAGRHRQTLAPRKSTMHEKPLWRWLPLSVEEGSPL